MHRAMPEHPWKECRKLASQLAAHLRDGDCYESERVSSQLWSICESSCNSEKLGSKSLFYLGTLQEHKIGVVPLPAHQALDIDSASMFQDGIAGPDAHGTGSLGFFWEREGLSSSLGCQI